MLISGNITMKPINEEVFSNTIISFINNNDVYEIADYYTFSNEEKLKKEFEKIQKEVKSLKLQSFKGNFIFKTGPREYSSFKLTKNKITSSPCEINISIKKERKKSNKKKLNFDQQLNLFSECIKKEKQLPQPDQVYKEFEVGKFYSKMQIQKVNVERVDEKVNEILNN